ncbi:phospholipid scramblase 1-like [Eleutherodactylus coqui]|uniref:phospholipid scramblase 1-like n=1 Tax=Eleutherodactylus coqui TaxID=57060 RepID=UPI003462EFAB
MDPQSAGHSWNKNSEPVETQPQWQNTSRSSEQQQLYSPRAVVPPGLESLVRLEEVYLQDGVFLSKSFETLFKIRRDFECCGPSINLMFQDPNGRLVVSLRKESGGDCCGVKYSRLRIIVLPATTIGFVKISISSLKMKISIETHLKEPVFVAELPFPLGDTLEILNINGSCPVAKIIYEAITEYSKVVFQFPMDMDATLKTVILAAFLYMRYCLAKLPSNGSSSNDSKWGYGGYSGDCGDYGDGGDGGGGGDCDCLGGDGDCAGGDGDCGGGDGGD